MFLADTGCEPTSARRTRTSIAAADRAGVILRLVTVRNNWDTLFGKHTSTPRFLLNGAREKKLNPYPNLREKKLNTFYLCTPEMWTKHLILK